MINNKFICINGKFYSEIKDLKGVPTPGKKIQVDGKPLPIRCCLRYVDEENEVTNLYIDLIREK